MDRHELLEEFRKAQDLNVASVYEGGAELVYVDWLESKLLELRTAVASNNGFKTDGQ